MQLKEVIKSLEEAKAELVARLESDGLGDSEIEEVVVFARKLERGLENADRDFSARRRIIELLDVRGVLAIEDGEKVIYVTFRLNKGRKEGERLSVSNWPKLEQQLVGSDYWQKAQAEV